MNYQLRLTSILLILISALGCEKQQTPQPALGEQIGEEKSVEPTNVSFTVNGEVVDPQQKQPITPKLVMGERSEILARFELPKDIKTVPRTSLKAVRTRPDGQEIIQTSVGGLPKKLEDGTYEIAFDVQGFNKPMVMEVRIQSPLAQLPYVLPPFQVEVVKN